jgi:hypothetical protein
LRKWRAITTMKLFWKCWSWDTKGNTGKIELQQISFMFLIKIQSWFMRYYKIQMIVNVMIQYQIVLEVRCWTIIDIEFEYKTYISVLVMILIGVGGRTRIRYWEPIGNLKKNW